MKNVTTLSDAELLSETRVHVRRSNELDADLLVLLGEVEARNLFLERAYAKMHHYCVRELGMSDDVAYFRMHAARLARQFPVILDCVRDGRIHLSGLRILGPHLNAENVETLLASAANKTKADIEYLVACIAPKAPVEARMTKVPTPAAPPSPPTPAVGIEEPAPILTSPPAPPPPRPAEASPLSADTYRVTFTADAALKRKLEQALELLGHQVKHNDFATVFEMALDVLLPRLLKDRHCVVAKPRSTVEEAEARENPTRHIAAPMQRAIHKRDDDQCTFVSEDGRRCTEKRCLEYHHLDGWARVKEHKLDRITLRCRAHNQYDADKMYGREFMEAKRRRRVSPRGENETLF